MGRAIRPTWRFGPQKAGGDKRHPHRRCGIAPRLRSFLLVWRETTNDPNQHHKPVLAEHPKGQPDDDTLRLETEDPQTPGKGQMLLRNEYLSLAPYMRGRISDAPCRRTGLLQEIGSRRRRTNRLLDRITSRTKDQKQTQCPVPRLRHRPLRCDRRYPPH
ncbi:hypothetical protein [Pseudogemmobacter sp. W21_MBD1_M6]|uniref:hypothetical protein n=1 Tax=Pseudogemmobacter sp. W21_MBD1_M6 TaxID=3240271 RepID=UPI003F97EA06